MHLFAPLGLKTNVDDWGVVKGFFGIYTMIKAFLFRERTVNSGRGFPRDENALERWRLGRSNTSSENANEVQMSLFYKVDVYENGTRNKRFNDIVTSTIPQKGPL